MTKEFGIINKHNYENACVGKTFGPNHTNQLRHNNVLNYNPSHLYSSAQRLNSWVDHWHLSPSTYHIQTPLRFEKCLSFFWFLFFLLFSFFYFLFFFSFFSFSSFFSFFSFLFLFYVFYFFLFLFYFVLFCFIFLIFFKYGYWLRPLAYQATVWFCWQKAGKKTHGFETHLVKPAAQNLQDTLGLQLRSIRRELRLQVGPNCLQVAAWRIGLSNAQAWNETVVERNKKHWRRN